MEEYREGQSPIPQSDTSNSGNDCDVDVVDVDGPKPEERAFQGGDFVRVTWVDENGEPVSVEGRLLRPVPNKPGIWDVVLDGDGVTMWATESEMEHIDGGEPPANTPPPQFHAGMRVRVTEGCGGYVTPGATGTLGDYDASGWWEIRVDGYENLPQTVAEHRMEPLPPSEDPKIDHACGSCAEPCGECDGEVADEGDPGEAVDGTDSFEAAARDVISNLRCIPMNVLQRIAQSATAHLANAATKAQRNEASLRDSLAVAVESAREQRLRARRAERDARMLAEAVVNARWYRGPSASHRQLAADVLAGKAREPKDEFAAKESPYGD